MEESLYLYFYSEWLFIVKILVDDLVFASNFILLITIKSIIFLDNFITRSNSHHLFILLSISIFLKLPSTDPELPFFTSLSFFEFVPFILFFTNLSVMLLFNFPKNDY